MKAVTIQTHKKYVVLSRTAFILYSGMLSVRIYMDFRIFRPEKYNPRELRKSEKKKGFGLVLVTG